MTIVVTDEAIPVLNPGSHGPTSGDPYVIYVEIVVCLFRKLIHLTRFIINERIRMRRAEMVSLFLSAKPRWISIDPNSFIAPSQFLNLRDWSHFYDYKISYLRSHKFTAHNMDYNLTCNTNFEPCINNVKIFYISLSNIQYFILILNIKFFHIKLKERVFIKISRITKNIYPPFLF